MMPDGSHPQQISQMLEQFYLFKAKLTDYISIRLDLHLECINDWAEIEKTLDNIDAYAYGCLFAFYKVSKLLPETERPSIYAFLKNPKSIVRFVELKVNLAVAKLHTGVSNRLFCQELAIFSVAQWSDILEKVCRKQRQADYPWVKSTHIVQSFNKNWWYARTGIDKIAPNEMTIDKEPISPADIMKCYAAREQQYLRMQQRKNETNSTSTTNNNSTSNPMRPGNPSRSSK